MPPTSLAPGLRGIAALTVSDRDTATAYGSGSVPVLATPRLVALMEQAAVDATRGKLAPGETTVGTRIDVAHLSPTPIAATVRAEATLEAIDGRSLRFSVVAWEGKTKIAEGTHLRAVIDEARFLQRLRTSR
jgi:fluoroacetyl-CoA thioesterase